MDVLWAPWRMTYIIKAVKEKECIFCRAVSSSDDEANKVVYRSEHSIVVLNIYPYNTAHVMVAPKRHVPRPDLLSDEEVADLHKTLILTIKAVEKEYNPQGFNIGMNIGRVAGAGVEGHMHIHVVPRWMGDSNFMPVIGETKVIPEDLTQTYRRLKASFNSLSL
jgi:ATP adenylyltransferase